MKWLSKIIRCLGHCVRLELQLYFLFSPAQFLLHTYSYLFHFASGLLLSLSSLWKGCFSTPQGSVALEGCIGLVLERSWRVSRHSKVVR